jgi:hypothetical protein
MNPFAFPSFLKPNFCNLRVTVWSDVFPEQKKSDVGLSKIKPRNSEGDGGGIIRSGRTVESDNKYPLWALKEKTTGKPTRQTSQRIGTAQHLVPISPPENLLHIVSLGH